MQLPNSETVKTTASLLQALVFLGGIGVAINEFAFGKIEERERVRNSIPLLEKAYSEKFENARSTFRDQTVVMMGAQMAGPDDTQSPEYRSASQLMQLERESADMLGPLSSYYTMMSQCVTGHICSEWTTFHTLCLDATQHWRDLERMKELTEARFALEGSTPLTDESMGNERARQFARLRGFATFSSLCEEWNAERTDRPVAVARDAFRTPL